MSHERSSDAAFFNTSFDRPRKASRLERAASCKRHNEPDSPLFRLLKGSTPPQVDHEKTDIFRRNVSYSREFKGKLRKARGAGAGKDVAALDSVRVELGDIGAAEAAVVLDLFLSYRGAKAGDRMTELYLEIDPVLQHTACARTICLSAQPRRLWRRGRNRAA
jgi:hypothetical protein